MKPGGTFPAPRIAVPGRIASDILTGLDRNAAVVDLGGKTMGTDWKVRLALPIGRDQAPIAAAIQRCLDNIEAQMSHWDPTSLLRAYNESDPGDWMTLPGEFAQVIAASLSVAERSGGAFDPAIGRVTDIWGLGPNPAPQAPGEHEISTALSWSGVRRMAYDAQASRLRQPGGLWLDLSGIAKGYAVDAVAELLAGMDIRHALVEIGGECIGRGMRPDGDPWWVDLETPPGLSLPPLRIALHGLAVATSGDYVRGFHTIDPRTGYPVLRSATVSVIHESAMLADGWASALIVLGPQEAQRLAKREHLAVRYIHDDIRGGEWLSPMLAVML